VPQPTAPPRAPYKDFWEQKFTFDFTVENRTRKFLRNTGTNQFTQRHNSEVYNRNINRSDNIISVSDGLIALFF
jgi:hypothetical protein